jgi:hypothetical protein
MPFIALDLLRRSKQASHKRHDARKAVGLTKRIGANSCAALALLMSSLVSTGALHAAETPEAAKQRIWREAVSQAPLPKKKGCFEANYPDTQWRETPCKAVPLKPYLPSRGPRADTVGDRNDISAQAPTGRISSVTGSFDRADVTSESDSYPPQGCSGPSSAGGANTFSLQINANTSPTSPLATVCSGGSASCVAWQQFVYTSNGSSPGSFVMQYWLINYGTESNQSCPTAGGPSNGWTFYDNVNNCLNPPVHQYDCYGDGASAEAPDALSSLSQLGQLRVVATASGGAGAQDTAKLFLSGVKAAAISNDDNIVDLSQFWTAAEFNVFGDCCGAQANFNSGSTIVPRTEIVYGGTGAPDCLAQGFTGETNNLSFGPTAPATTPPGPAVSFTESSAGGAPSDCAAASTIGDTHIHPFNQATEYDFQAFGDFILAKAGPDFLVHTRQTPGPPGYPGTATNTAVAVLMGKTRIAIYLHPQRLVINGDTNNLADGKSILLSSGVLVSRHGIEYRISDGKGNRVIADLVKSGAEPFWMNVTVGLGHTPDKTVRGLLGNPTDKADEISTSNGLVLKVPVAATDLYGKFADSWRVDPAKSLFVELPPAPVGAPAKPLVAKDLSPADKAHAIQVCKAAGVTNEALLDDCILDTTVLKDDDAVKVFTKVLPPKLVIKPVVAQKTVSG